MTTTKTRLALLTLAAAVIFARPAGAGSRVWPPLTCSTSATVTIGPFAEDLKHVQGISFSTDAIFISSVDKNSAAALLWKFDRRTLKKIRLRNLADNFQYHAGGLQFDGKYIWLPIAVYLEKSNSKILKIDPSTLRVISKFSVPDHIGLVTSNGSGSIIGANWDARIFYFWKEDGTLIETRHGPSPHGYQDCKAADKLLICSGGGAVDFINIKDWRIEKSYIMPDVQSGDNATREGMDFQDGKFFMLPGDGAGSRIHIFKPGKDCDISD